MTIIFNRNDFFLIQFQKYQDDLSPSFVSTNILKRYSRLSAKYNNIKFISKNENLFEGITFLLYKRRIRAQKVINEATSFRPS